MKRSLHVSSDMKNEEAYFLFFLSMEKIQIHSLQHWSSECGISRFRQWFRIDKLVFLYVGLDYKENKF